MCVIPYDALGGACARTPLRKRYIYSSQPQRFSLAVPAAAVASEYALAALLGHLKIPSWAVLSLFGYFWVQLFSLGTLQLRKGKRKLTLKK